MVPDGITMAQWALRWCLDFDAVSAVIPGAKNPDQAKANAAASDLSPLGNDSHRKLRAFYEDKVRQHIRGPY
jgi:aryl-alcohol dehydrogenase-like predicted oxidoreductase